MYTENQHRKIFEQVIDRINQKNRNLLATVYLLTAEPSIWQIASASVTRDSIDFENMTLGSLRPTEYTLFAVAKDLYCGTELVSISDLANRNLLPEELFRLVCSALCIGRHGKKVLEE